MPPENLSPAYTYLRDQLIENHYAGRSRRPVTRKMVVSRACVAITWMLSATACVVVATAQAASMTFSHGGVVESCRDPKSCKEWVFGKGEITEQTPKEFKNYLKANPYAPHLVRLESPGGSLSAGIELGQAIRSLGFATEATTCASACTYAFMGGVERDYVSPTSRVGVHRFYQDAAVMAPTSKQFTGDDLDGTQRVMAGLMLYAVSMGVDLKLIALTAEAGPGEMRWINSNEASELKLTYNPGKWMPWRLEGDVDHGGIVAISQTQDSKRTMQIYCASNTVWATLTDDNIGTFDWFQQCASAAANGHPVLGLRVPKASTVVGRWNKTGGSISFELPVAKRDFSRLEFFADMASYPMACISETDEYVGTTEKFKTMATATMATCRK